MSKFASAVLFALSVTGSAAYAAEDDLARTFINSSCTSYQVVRANQGKSRAQARLPVCRIELPEDPKGTIRVVHGHDSAGQTGARN